MLGSVAQNITFGILLGALYGLVAVGLSLVFGVTKFLNVAHGELLMIGGYASFWLFSLLGLDPFASIPVTILVMVLLGAVLYKLLFSRMVKLPEETKIKNTLLVGFGASVILQNIALRLFTADDRAVTVPYSGTVFTLWGIRLPIVRLISLGISLVFLLGLQLFLRRTYTGKAIRATVQDWEAASMMGINTQKVYLLAFVIGVALAGVGGTLVSVNFSIEPAMGLNWTLKAMIVMVLGGLGSITGTFIGGILLGVTESLTSILISSNYREVVGLLLFIIILIFRPQGLLGKKEH